MAKLPDWPAGGRLAVAATAITLSALPSQGSEIQRAYFQHTADCLHLFFSDKAAHTAQCLPNNNTVPMEGTSSGSDYVAPPPPPVVVVVPPPPPVIGENCYPGIEGCPPEAV